MAIRRNLQSCWRPNGVKILRGLSHEIEDAMKTLTSSPNLYVQSFRNDSGPLAVHSKLVWCSLLANLVGPPYEATANSQ